MTEREFIKRYYNSFKPYGRLKNTGEAKRRIEIFFETLMDVIESDEKIIFKNWGKFEIEHRGERIYGNPITQERIVIPPKRVLKFTAGKSLAEKIKNS